MYLYFSVVSCPVSMSASLVIVVVSLPPEAKVRVCQLTASYEIGLSSADCLSGVRCQEESDSGLPLGAR